MFRLAFVSLVTANLQNFLQDVPTELTLTTNETPQLVDEGIKVAPKAEESELEPMFTDFWWVCVGVALCKSCF